MCLNLCYKTYKMKLTERENQEIDYLRGLQQSRTIPMMQGDQNRLKYLNQKEFHNCCSKPSCTGYTGSESETKCIKCGADLHKLI